MSNWYKIAEKSKNPYNIYKYAHGRVTLFEPAGIIFAYSEEQARMMALNKYPELRMYLEMSSEYSVEAKLNVKENNDVLKFRDHRKKSKEKEIQNTWWNED